MASVLIVRTGVLLFAPIVLLAQTEATVRQAALARVPKARAMAADPEIVGAPALDASTGTFAIQMSVPVLEQGKRGGALTVTLKVARGRPIR